MHLIDLAALTPREIQLAKSELGNHRDIQVIRPILHGPIYDEAIFGQVGLNIAMRWEDPMLDMEIIQINRLREPGKTWCLVLFVESARPIILEVSPKSSPMDAPFGSLHLRWPDDTAIDLLIQLQSQLNIPPIPVAVSVGNYLLLQRASPAG